MSEYFAFRFKERDGAIQESLVIFFMSRISLDAIARILKDDITANLVAKNIYLISRPECQITKQACMSDLAFTNEFNSYVGDPGEKLHCVSFSSSGKLTYCIGTPVSQAITRVLLHSGMMALFKKHRGLIESSHGYHFEKPSGDHCDKFIRASNLLVSSVEVSFLAIRLLPHLRKDLKRIYVDSSSISFLVSIAIQLFGEFDDGPPAIISFESYAVFKKAFDFVVDKSSILLISATTSGSLARDLSETKQFSRDQIVTLFHVNLPVGQIGLFDVEQAGAEGLISSKSSECIFCKRDWKLLRIAGEQFLLEDPRSERLVIKKSDFDKSRQDFFRQFAATNVLQWNRAANPADDHNEHFFIAAENAITNATGQFSDSLQKSLRKYVTRALATVIVFEDDGSRALGSKVRDYLGADADSLKWLTPRELDESSLADNGSVMVLVGAITSGRSVQSVARKLRGIHQLSTITYLVAFSKLPNEAAAVQLKKDLSQGGNELVILTHCAVPRIKEYTNTAWDAERKKLEPFGKDDSLGSDLVLPKPLQERRRQRMANSCDSQKLFLPDGSSRPLKLRPTFAFWADLGIIKTRWKSATQADVYWTVQTVLHDLRNPAENKGLNSTYHTTLLSPANFDRYNDGVIQACLLRAALPIEMNYRIDHDCSRQMTDVIASVLCNWDNAQGEAALEFVMALWTERLSLADEHLREIVEFRNKNVSDSLRFILERLSERLEASS